MNDSLPGGTSSSAQAWRVILFCAGAMALVFAYGFYNQASWATRLWPWADGRMTYIFVSSIAAAIAVPNLWIAFARRPWAIAPGALNLAVSHLGIGAFLFTFASQGDAPVLMTASVFVLAGIVETIAVFWSMRQPVTDARRTPPVVRTSFAMFAIVLVVTGYFLVTKAPHVFPWPLEPETSVLIGWIFWGAALYFAAGFVRPVWENACGQLLGFLAYDVILIGPYVAHLRKVKPEHALSLKVYIAVLTYSGLLAIYFLFVQRTTRFRARTHSDSSTDELVAPVV